MSAKIILHVEGICVLIAACACGRWSFCAKLISYKNALIRQIGKTGDVLKTNWTQIVYIEGNLTSKESFKHLLNGFGMEIFYKPLSGHSNDSTSKAIVKY